MVPSIGIQIGAEPDSGFDDPIGMLRDCHRRIEHFLHILSMVVERAQGRMLSDEEASAVQAALQYFCVGGRRHTADEEESLFPRLRADSSVENLVELKGLESDHTEADVLHGSVESLYSTWIAQGGLRAEEQQRLLDQTRHLQGLYADHIEIEENHVFPRAAQRLDQETIALIGKEFRARRA